MLIRPFVTKLTGPLTVVGDLHGQRAKLESLLGQLKRRPDFEWRWLVFVGDFLDRGPDPRGTLELVMRLRQRHALTTAVMGNHDLAIAGALGLIAAPKTCNWDRRYLESYDCASTFKSYDALIGDLDALARVMPRGHKQFLSGLPWVVEHRKYLVVHAGLTQDLPFRKQLVALRRRDFTLNRPEWLCERELAEGAVPPGCKKTIVSGHVYVPEVRFAHRRILLDTTGGGAGELSAVLLPEGTVLSSDAQ